MSIVKTIVCLALLNPITEEDVKDIDNKLSTRWVLSRPNFKKHFQAAYYYELVLFQMGEYFPEIIWPVCGKNIYILTGNLKLGISLNKNVFSFATLIGLYKFEKLDY